ncbi:hypothetical protein OEB96_01510 [Paraliomyxa miuraensis]|nr:hypothetical protein [Paraliomyxa miuraensis]
MMPLLLSSLVSFASTPAGSTDASEVIATDPIPNAEAPRPDIVAPMPDARYSVMVNRRARGVGLGFHQGLWGRGLGQSLHLDVPFGRRTGQFFGMRLAGTVVHGEAEGRYDPVGFGHVELFGRSPVIAGVVRAYGGGGVLIGGRLHPEITGPRYGLAGGGHFGLEAFIAPRVSISMEVGAQGPVHALGLDAGARVVGGVNVWLGALRRDAR